MVHIRLCESGCLTYAQLNGIECDEPLRVNCQLLSSSRISESVGPLPGLMNATWRCSVGQWTFVEFSECSSNECKVKLKRCNFPNLEIR